MPRKYTNEELRKNNRNMEHVALMALRKAKFKGKKYKTFDTPEEQLLGDALIGKHDYVEIKHRDSKYYQDYKEGKGIQIYYPKKWTEKSILATGTKNSFWFINSFPELGVMLVHRIPLATLRKKEGKYVKGKYVYTCNYASHKLEPAYTKKHLEMWNETRQIVRDGGSIFEEDEGKHLAPNEDTKKSEIDMVIDRKEAHLALLEANFDDIRETIRDLKDEIAILEAAKKVMQDA